MRSPRGGHTNAPLSLPRSARSRRGRRRKQEAGSKKFFVFIGVHLWLIYRFAQVLRSPDGMPPANLPMRRSFLPFRFSFLSVSSPFLSVSAAFLPVRFPFLSVSAAFLSVSLPFLSVRLPFLSVSAAFLSMARSWEGMPRHKPRFLGRERQFLNTKTPRHQEHQGRSADFADSADWRRRSACAMPPLPGDVRKPCIYKGKGRCGK
jgi:hypothetical protein